MDKGRGGEDRLPRTMGCPGPGVTLLWLGITFLTLLSISDAATISPRLPKQITMMAIIVVEQEPLNLDRLSLSWDHNGRPLVEYRDNHVTAYDPRVSMPQDQFKDGDFSLILNNISMNDTGNYTCLIQYDMTQQIIQYILRVEKHKIQLHNLSPRRIDENIDNKESSVKLMKRSSKKTARESKQPTSRWFLDMAGHRQVIVKPGQNITLMCKFYTDPSMELTMLNIRWSKDGVTKWIYNKDLPEDQAKVEELLTGNANLNLINIQRKDSGKYTCNIKYRTLEKYLSTLVIVEVQESSQSDLENQYFLKITGSPLVTTMLGVNVTLPCHFRADRSMELSMLTITWSKDGKVIRIISKDTKLDESQIDELLEEKADLHLRNIRMEDGGRYVCDIKYRSLEKNVTTTLIVKDSSASKEENDQLSTCETVVVKRLDQIIKWSEQVNTKLEELKKCIK